MQYWQVIVNPCPFVLMEHSLNRRAFVTGEAGKKKKKAVVVIARYHARRKARLKSPGETCSVRAMFGRAQG